MNNNDVRKLLGAAGLSTLAAPVINAGIVESATIPTTGLNPPSAPTSGDTNWDVDGDGTTDFQLGRYVNTFSVIYHDFDDQNGGRLVVPTIRAQDGLARRQDGIAPLNVGETVGATLAAGLQFHTRAQSSNTIIRDQAATGGSVAIYPDAAGFQAGVPGLFGFRFTSDASGTTQTFYGWGEMLIAADLSTFTVTRAWYEDVAGASIRVGAVPEPAEVGLGLGALALGAAGLRRTRRAKAGKKGS